MRDIPGYEPLLTPGEVARIFRVDPKTVARWARDGRITPVRTPGNHRRFRESEIRSLLAGVVEGNPQQGEASVASPRGPEAA